MRESNLIKYLLLIFIMISFFSLDLIRAKITGKVMYNYPNYIKSIVYITESFDMKNVENLTPEDKFLLATKYPYKLTSGHLNKVVDGCPMFVDFIGYRVGRFPASLINKVDVSRIYLCKKIINVWEEIFFESSDSGNVALSIINSLNMEERFLLKEKMKKKYGLIILPENLNKFGSYLITNLLSQEDTIRLLSLTNIRHLRKDIKLRIVESIESLRLINLDFAMDMSVWRKYAKELISEDS